MRRGLVPWPLVLALVLAGCFAPGGGVDLDVTVPEALIWGAPYAKLTIQVDHAEGREPSKLALDAMVEMLYEVTDKRVIELVGPTSIGTAKPPGKYWSGRSLDSFHRATYAVERHPPFQGDRAFLHVIYLAGAMGNETDHHIQGLQGGAEIYIFPDTIRNEGGPRHPAAEKVERAVLIHEVGHALGLVDCGIPMVRPHAGRWCHSANERSVMYGSDIAISEALLDLADEGGHIHYRFDEDDLRDLASFRERGRSGNG